MTYPLGKPDDTFEIVHGMATIYEDGSVMFDDENYSHYSYATLDELEHILLLARAAKEARREDESERSSETVS